MGGILNEHVEWAVVSRMKAMLSDPPKTKFNVTQSFALFSAIVLWTKQRVWVSDNLPLNQTDQSAKAVRSALRGASIFEEPWSLSRVRGEHSTIQEPEVSGSRINVDFEEMTTEQFIKWLRNALAHGDGRTIKPIHKLAKQSDKSLLAGFEIQARANRDRERLLTLYHADMRRIGAVLADTFCQALSGGDKYFEQEAATKVIEKAA
jgi:hypothetical protein